MVIRKARVSDSKSISRLIQETLSRVNSRDYGPDQIAVWKKRNTPAKLKEKIKDKTRYECVAVVRGKIVGYGSLKKKELVSLYTQADLIGRGIGSQIYRHLEKKLRKRGTKVSRISATLTALDFYQKQGYRKIKDSKQRFENLEIPCVIMEKNLS